MCQHIENYNPVCTLGSVEKAFQDPDGNYDYCINCAAETKFGQTEQVDTKFWVKFLNIFT